MTPIQHTRLAESIATAIATDAAEGEFEAVAELNVILGEVLRKGLVQ